MSLPEQHPDAPVTPAAGYGPAAQPPQPAEAPAEAPAPAAANAGPYAHLDIPVRYRDLFDDRLGRTHGVPGQRTIDFVVAVLERRDAVDAAQRAAAAAGAAATAATTETKKEAEKPAPTAYESATVSELVGMFPGNIAMNWAVPSEGGYDYPTARGVDFYKAADVDSAPEVGAVTRVVDEMGFGSDAPREVVAFSPLHTDMYEHVTAVDGYPKKPEKPGEPEEHAVFTVVNYGITGKTAAGRDVMVLVELVWPKERAAALNEGLGKDPRSGRRIVTWFIESERARLGKGPHDDTQAQELKRLGQIELAVKRFAGNIDAQPLPALVRLSSDPNVDIGQKPSRSSAYARNQTIMLPKPKKPAK